jgi:hypothetical protein
MLDLQQGGIARGGISDSRTITRTASTWCSSPGRSSSAEKTASSRDLASGANNVGS